ncbi:hypothetical protein B0H34DRAFT_733675 [Crassisporium funariophilum]|nr:hypothetical protein B0H34DRAFT_733675 [Crassisporium funariophilum]
MSGPFVYTPQVNYRNSPYLAPFYDQAYSPFIPSLSLSGSPYARNASLPPSPNLGFSPLPTPYTPSIPFPGSPDDGGFGPDVWARQRRPSWHGGTVPTATVPTGWLQAPAGYHHQRTRSFGDAAAYQTLPVGWNGQPFAPGACSPYGPPPFTIPQIQPSIHPWLNAEMLRSDFIFDMSLSNFAPMRYVGNNQTVIISPEELSQPATHPPIFQMNIVCEQLPKWPISMQYNPYTSSNTYPTVAPPITLGDVLSAIWNSMQQRISQYDWAQLPPQVEYAVSRAYTKRCKAMPSTEVMVRNQGVKRVDFLLEKVMFRGLVRVGEGLENWKLIVG